MTINSIWAPILILGSLILLLLCALAYRSIRRRGGLFRRCFVCKRGTIESDYHPREDLKHINQDSIYGVCGEKHYSYHERCLEAVLRNPEQHAESHGMSIVDTAVDIESVLQSRRNARLEEIQKNQETIDNARRLARAKFQEEEPPQIEEPKEEEGEPASRYSMMKDD